MKVATDFADRTWGHRLRLTSRAMDRKAKKRRTCMHAQPQQHGSVLSKYVATNINHHIRHQNDSTSVQISWISVNPKRFPPYVLLKSNPHPYLYIVTKLSQQDGSQHIFSHFVSTSLFLEYLVSVLTLDSCEYDNRCLISANWTSQRNTSHLVPLSTKCRLSGIKLVAFSKI